MRLLRSILLAWQAGAHLFGSRKTPPFQELAQKFRHENVNFTHGRTSVQETKDEMMKAIDERLERMLAHAHSEDCKKRIAHDFADFMVSEIEEHGPWMNEKSRQITHSFKSQCPENSSRSTEQPDAKKISIFFLITLHRYPKMVSRIVKALHHTNHFFALHLDGQSPPALLKELEEVAAPYDNVAVMNDRVNVTWGSFSMVQVALKGIQLALHLNDYATEAGMQEMKYDYFINMAETSYPLLPEPVLRQRLAEKPKGTNFMSMTKMKIHSNEFFNFIDCDERIHRVGKLQTPHGIDLWLGSQWVVLTPPFMRWVIENNHKYNNFLSRVRIPDESYFQTLLRSSPFCHDYEKYDMHFVNWDRDAKDTEWKCLMPNKKHCGRSPVVLRSTDLPLIQASGKPFARKFDPNVDTTVLDTLDNMRSQLQQKFLLSNGKEGVKYNEGGGALLNNVVFSKVVKNNDGEEEKYCVTSSTQSGKETVWFEKCAEDHDRREWQQFTVGPCWGTTKDIKISREGCVSPSADRQPVPLHCEVRPMKAPTLCLDLAGQTTNLGHPVLLWECQKTWNQLWDWSHDSCSLKLTPPKEHTNEGEAICLQPQPVGEKSHWADAILGQRCADDEALQKFRITVDSNTPSKVDNEPPKKKPFLESMKSVIKSFRRKHVEM